MYWDGSPVRPLTWHVIDSFRSMDSTDGTVVGWKQPRPPVFCMCLAFQAVGLR